MSVLRLFSISYYESHKNKITGSLEMKIAMPNTQEDAYEVQLGTALLISSLGKHTAQQVLALCNSFGDSSKNQVHTTGFSIFSS